VAPALPLFVAQSNPRLQNVCDALSQFLEFTGRWDERLALNQQAEAKAVAAGDPQKAGWRAFQAGAVHAMRGQAEAVLACANRAASHWQIAQAGARERASAILLRGRAHLIKADFRAAIAACREALDLHRSVSAESVSVAIALTDLANAEGYSGNLDAAERDYREALRIARAVGHAEMMAGIPAILAGLALGRQDWPGAETLAREALSLCEELGRQELIAYNCHGLARALVKQGKKAEALPHARRAVEIYTQLGSPDLGSARATLAECESGPGASAG
jgi:tetratricopeptide (TPR) repeat protein